MSEMIIKKLNQALDSKKVKSRIQNGMSLSYIEGFQAEATANDIFNFCWNKETIFCDKVFERGYTDKNGKEMFEVAYSAKVRVSVEINGQEVKREGIGAGNGRSSDLFGAYELAMKEAETDATKRALKSFGDQFGLSLYDKNFDAKKEFEDAKRFDLEFQEKLTEINEISSTEEGLNTLRNMYKTYDGKYKEDVLYKILSKIKAVKEDLAKKEDKNETI